MGEWRVRRASAYVGRVAVAAIIALSLIPLEALAAPTIGPPTLIGSMSNSNLSEISGLVDGRATPNTFWVHNDSGDSARFFAINRQGGLLGTISLSGAAATDWEDIAIGPNPSGGAYLYIADMGDNALARSFITIYRVPEPIATATATIDSSTYSTARLIYPSGARNAEALIVDPLTGDLVIVTKSSTPQVYWAPASAFEQSSTTLSLAGSLGTPMNSPTAADISPDGRHVLVRSKTTGRMYERLIGQSVADALRGVGVTFSLGSEPQGEAIAWAADGRSFFTTSEKDGQPTAPIYSYAFNPNWPGDFDGNGVVDNLDLVKWQAAQGVDGSADADGDGDSDGADVLLWQRSLTVSALTAVPEPGTSILVALILLVLPNFYCRRHSS